MSGYELTRQLRKERAFGDCLLIALSVSEDAAASVSRLDEARDDL